MASDPAPATTLVLAVERAARRLGERAAPWFVNGEVVEELRSDGVSATSAQVSNALTTLRGSGVVERVPGRHGWRLA